jgi:hypothetical protein
MPFRGATVCRQDAQLTAHCSVRACPRIHLLNEVAKIGQEHFWLLQSSEMTPRLHPSVNTVGTILYQEVGCQLRLWR